MESDIMPLGKGDKAVFSRDCTKTGVNNNVVVCGSSGSGKTMSIIEPRLIGTYNSSLVVTVTKRKIVKKYTDMFLGRGYKVLDLNFAQPKKSMVGYDLMKYVSSYTDIKFLADYIMNSGDYQTKSYDPYWSNAGSSLLASMIAYTMMMNKDATFTNVIKMIDLLEITTNNDDDITTNLDYRFEEVNKKDPLCFTYSCWKTFRTLPFRTASCVYGTVKAAISHIFPQEIIDMMSMKNTVDIDDIAKEKTVLFITTSAVNPSLNCFVNLFYSQLFKQLFEFAETQPDAKLPIPVSVLCDDFATGSRILNFPEYISLFREKQIDVTLLLQSESQLEKMYGYQDAVTIINNCDTYVYIGGMDLQTCLNISRRLNVPLEDVMYMPIGKEVIFRRGQKPIRTERYNIAENLIYKTIDERYNKCR